MSWVHVAFVVAYFLGFQALALTIVWWQRKRLKKRRPFGDELLLLRAPGESGLKHYLQDQGNYDIHAMAASGLPLVVGLTLFWLVTKLTGLVQIVALVVAIIGFVVCFALGVRWFGRKAVESGNRYLGYFGERIVGEFLDGLKARGYRVFHDVPGVANGHRFNLDHVVIGPGGVFVIETKTFRKGGGIPGRDDGKVTFDGQNLDWPWGVDNEGLEQAERNALWLMETLKKESGQRVHVTPLLVLTCWFLVAKITKPRRLCRPVNHKWLPREIGDSPSLLSSAAVETLSGCVETRCRDVSYF